MHYSNTKYNGRTTRGGSVILLNKIRKIPPPIEGGALSNKIVGITSNAVKSPPQSMAMASVFGGMLDFNKHVKASRKKKEKEENIRFVY
jgi:hypothetical protein